MSYCSNCGGRLNDQGLCPNCGGMSESTINPKQKGSSAVLECLKESVVSSPLKGMEQAARSRSASVWITFGALYVISSVASILVSSSTMPPDYFRTFFGPRVADAVAGTAGEASDKMMSCLVSLLTHSAAMSILELFVLVLITCVAFMIAEEKTSFTQALNISAFSTLPYSIITLAAIPVSLISIPLATQLPILGLIAGAIIYYFGIQKASTFRKSPFWLLFISVIVGEAVLILCSFGLSLLLF